MPTLVSQIPLTPATLGILLAGGLLAGFMNVVAGGGALISMPALMLVGLPATAANGTARVAILVQCVTALFRYHKSDAIDWRTASPLIVPTILAAGAGAWAGTLIPATGFRNLLGGVTLAAGLMVAVDLKKRIGGSSTGGGRSRWFWPAFVGACFYGGMLQAGVGYLFLASMSMLGGISLTSANVIRLLLATAYTPLVLVIFASGGHVYWMPAAVLSVGQALGAWIAAGWVIKEGARFIRGALLVILAISAMDLLGWLPF